MPRNSLSRTRSNVSMSSHEGHGLPRLPDIRHGSRATLSRLVGRRLRTIRSMSPVAWIRQSATVLVASIVALSIAAMSTSSVHADVTPTGAYQTSIPIEVPPYHGLEPNLSLTYNSGGGNGWIGLGWSLSGLSRIERASPGRGAPNYDDKDMFLLDGVELVPCQQVTKTSPSCQYEIKT